VSGCASRRPAVERAFTLLEVLVAVSILGLGLTVILSSQVGLFSNAAQVEHLTHATNLARCKMEEATLELLTEGFSLLDEQDEGPCCEDEEDSKFRCAWKVQRVELPEPLDLDEALGGGLDGGVGSGAGLGPIGALAELSKTDGQALGEKPDMTSLAGFMGDNAASGVEGMVPMLMSLVYPSLKPMLEASIRKVTVRVLWSEGSREKELAVTQYVTNPQQGGLDALLAEQVPGSTGGTEPGSTRTSRPEDGP